jgi:hypothetical protein
VLEGIGGRYFEDCNQAETVDPPIGRTRARTPTGVARYAFDPANADRLWTVSQELLKAAE